MEKVNIHKAKTNLSKLVERVSKGEEIIISRAGKPVARLVPLDASRARNFGLFAGQVHIAADFDNLPEDITELFEGGR